MSNFAHFPHAVVAVMFKRSVMRGRLLHVISFGLALYCWRWRLIHLVADFLHNLEFGPSGPFPVEGVFRVTTGTSCIILRPVVVVLLDLFSTVTKLSRFFLVDAELGKGFLDCCLTPGTGNISLQQVVNV